MKEAERYLAVARIRRPQGRRGEVAAEILTDFPQRFEKLRRVWLDTPAGVPESAEIESAWPHKGGIVLKFSGVNSISGAERLRGRHVLIPREERVRLPAGSYYIWELAGCRVMRNAGAGSEVVGTVTEVEHTAGGDLLHVAGARDAKRVLLIPLAETICTRIDTKQKEIWIEPPEDLLDLNP